MADRDEWLTGWLSGELGNFGCAVAWGSLESETDWDLTKRWHD